MDGEDPGPAAFEHQLGGQDFTADEVVDEVRVVNNLLEPFAVVLDHPVSFTTQSYFGVPDTAAGPSPACAARS